MWLAFKATFAVGKCLLATFPGSKAMIESSVKKLSTLWAALLVAVDVLQKQPPPEI